jgi:hypothetical protein
VAVDFPGDRYGIAITNQVRYTHAEDVRPISAREFDSRDDQELGARMRDGRSEQVLGLSLIEVLGVLADSDEVIAAGSVPLNQLWDREGPIVGECRMDVEGALNEHAQPPE